MGTHRFALVVMALAACGDDSGSSSVDAAVGTGDVGTGDGGDAQMTTCGHTESSDATNSSVPNAEATTLTLSAATSPVEICGKLDAGHFDGANDLIDADGFVFNVAAESDIFIHLTGTGINGPDRTVVQILKQGVNQVFGFGIVEGDHATMIRHLPAGDYVAAIYALDTVATSAAIDYRVTIGLDIARCSTKTGTDFAEAGDGGTNNSNDVIEYSFTSNPESQLTDTTTDMAEATGITVAAGTSYLVTGSSANVDPSDDYMDRDTFAFTTGATTNQMSIRLNWPGTTTDLDYRVYPQSNIDPESVAGGLDTPAMEDEYETFAVKPNTTYWLWVGAEDGSSGPTAYSATLCGETFFP